MPMPVRTGLDEKLITYMVRFVKMTWVWIGGGEVQQSLEKRVEPQSKNARHRNAVMTEGGDDGMGWWEMLAGNSGCASVFG